MSATKAAVFLGLTENAVHSLDKEGLLPILSATGVHGTARSVYTPEMLLPIKEEFAAKMSYAKLSYEFGVSRHGVEQFVCLGLVRRMGGAVAHMHSQMQIDRRSVDDLRRRLVDAAARWAGQPTGQRRDENGAERSSPIGPAVKLMDVLHRMGGREKPWGPLLALLASGEVPFLLEQREAQLTSRMVVPVSAAGRIETLRFDRGDHPEFDFAPVMTRDDAEALFQVTSKVFRRALTEESGLAPCRANAAWMHVDGVLALSAERISFREIVRRWNPSGALLPAEFLERLAPLRLGVLGWSRIDVEQFMGPSRPMMVNAAVGGTCADRFFHGSILSGSLLKQKAP